MNNDPRSIKWRTDFDKAIFSPWPVLLWSSDFVTVAYWDHDDQVWTNGEHTFNQPFTQWAEVVSPVANVWRKQ